MRKFSNTIKALGIGCLLAGCSSAFNGPNEALSVERAHPISVDSQVVTLTIAIDESRSDTSAVDNARLRAFADSFLRSGHGPITITAPSGRGDDILGQEAAADIRKRLNAAGVPWSSIGGATYRTGDDRVGEVILSYTHYVATPSPCGLWSGIKEADRRNLRTPNFGCATQNNIAALVADPRDLVAPANEGYADAPARIRAIRAFREGEVSAVETDKEIETKVSN